MFSSNRRLHVSAYNDHHQVLTTFLLEELYIICNIDTRFMHIIYNSYSKKVVKT